MNKGYFKFLTLVVPIFLSYCNQKSDSNSSNNPSDKSIEITGEVLNPMSEKVVLEKIENNQLVGIDTFSMGDDNQFKFSLQLDEPDFYRINIGDIQKRILILNDSDMHIVAGGSGMNDSFDVEGSLEMDQIQDVDSIVEGINNKLVELNDQVSQAHAENDMDKVQKISQEFSNVRTEQEQELKNYIQTMEPSLAVISALSFLNLDQNIDFVEGVFSKVKEKYPTSSHILSFNDQLSNLKKLAIGQPAPDIHLPNPSGDTVSLSSLRGKVVLIDFWAAWCAPCRKENPNVVRLYNEYKDDGFEIYGVSLDRSKDAWVEAIRQDKLGWIHVSDLQYFDSQAAAIYNVEGIPFTVLLDREGNIIAKNLRGPSLENKLKEIFG